MLLFHSFSLPLVRTRPHCQLLTLLYSHRELTADKPQVKCWSSIIGYPQAVSHVYVHSAEGLQNQDRTGGWRTFHKLNFLLQHFCSAWRVFNPPDLVLFHAGADPYVIISCEGKSVKSTIHNDTLNPEFATSGVFYRKKLSKPITVQVMCSLSH